MSEIVELVDGEVWIVWAKDRNFPDIPVSLWSTQEKAEAEAARLQAELESWSDREYAVGCTSIDQP